MHASIVQITFQAVVALLFAAITNVRLREVSVVNRVVSAHIAALTATV